MRIEDLSLKKNLDLVTANPDSSVLDAVALLNRHNIGALPVCNASGALVGIISERDIVRGLPASRIDLDNLKVSDLMTSDVITCSPEDDVNEIMAIMDERHIRHIPVLEGGRLSTIVSSRDVMSTVLEEAMSRAKTMSLAYETVR